METRIREIAEAEYKEELFREEVDKYKEKLRTKRTFWDIVFPYNILIIKKESIR